MNRFNNIKTYVLSILMSNQYQEGSLLHMYKDNYRNTFAKTLYPFPTLKNLVLSKISKFFLLLIQDRHIFISVHGEAEFNIKQI